MSIKVPSKNFFGNNIDLQRQLAGQQDQNQIALQLKSLFEEGVQNYNQSQNEIFSDYLLHIYQFFTKTLDQNKLNALVEISAHIFTVSFSENLTYSQSYEEFKSVLIRHSLFRPPHSIMIFTLQEIKQITDYFLSTFYRYYTLYCHSFTAQINIEIRTFAIFKSLFPSAINLNQSEKINPNTLAVLREYLVDKETGLTEDELKLILDGDDIHKVPMKYRLEWTKKRQEKEKQQLIDRYMEGQIQELQKQMDEKIEQQDQDFYSKIEELKKTAKKK